MTDRQASQMDSLASLFFSMLLVSVASAAILSQLLTPWLPNGFVIWLVPALILSWSALAIRVLRPARIAWKQRGVLGLPRCKYCGTMLDSSMKVCPNCGARP